MNTITYIAEYLLLRNLYVRNQREQRTRMHSTIFVYMVRPSIIIRSDYSRDNYESKDQTYSCQAAYRATYELWGFEDIDVSQFTPHDPRLDQVPRTITNQYVHLDIVGPADRT